MQLKGKKGIVLGVANHRSLAWAIAQTANNEGAQVLITYQNERLEENAKTLAGELTNGLVYPCDLNYPEQGTRLREFISTELGAIDFIVHSIAFAKKEELAGRYLDTSRDGFLIAMESSVYSFVAAAQYLEPVLNDGGSLITLSYLGGERVMPNYNVMGVAKAALEASVRYMANDLGGRGIRVNALSPGPIQTLAARGVGGFSNILKVVEERAPLKRNIEQEDVAQAALFFLSNASKNITGEVLYVDCGYQIMGM